MSNIRFEQINNLAVIKLDRNEQNTLNYELLTEVYQKFQDLEKDPNIMVILVTSTSSKFFSNGIDIEQVVEEGAKPFKALFELFSYMFHMKTITVACMRGHAIAGGAAFALPFDFKFLGAKSKYVFNESLIGMPIPQPMIDAIVESVGYVDAKKACLFGKSYKGEEALKVGFVDFVEPEDQIEEKALFFSQSVSRRTPNILDIKSNLRHNLTSKKYNDSIEDLQNTLDTPLVKDTLKKVLERVKKSQK